ncbi:hypothetical protein GOP47_0010492 [Adiantum capillus-veneris]|uniref:Uncharacterized protein n=2 Tax=Adiantum capillus-veneris TaxID=13818 RepID=A0A9D4ZIT3_ADICA|nr:hypothetical protein GOP47_0010492 [Adiantum capillus-veneris]
MLLLTNSLSPAITSSLYLGCWQVSKARRVGASQAAWRGLGERRKLLEVSCSSSCGDGELGEQQENQIEWSVEGQVDKILGDQALMQDLNAAVERVANARRELEALEEQERQASITHNIDTANSLVAACQRDIFAAEMDLKNAEVALVRARAGMVSILGEEIFDKDLERLESAKAAGVCGMVGVLAGLPFFSLARDLNAMEMVASAAFILVSCAVFGLTYRYAVRRDLSNTQLRAGCIAAFSLVRCLAQVDAVRLFAGLPQQDVAQQLLQGCLFTGESIAIFAFAAVGLEYCFQQEIVSPFPLKQP